MTIAHRQRARLHAQGAHRHDDHKAGGDQGGLTHVEERERQAGLDRCRFILAHGAVVAVRLAQFGVEILDGFKVQQAVDRRLVASVSWSFISRRSFTRHSVTLKVKVT